MVQNTSKIQNSDYFWGFGDDRSHKAARFAHAPPPKTTGTAGVLQQRRVRKSRRVGLLRYLEVPGDTCGANAVNNNKR